ncbi:HD domain-containing protein [Orbus mooreae]|uniref:HD domain-containing protein n=1 Tax=Orbus mooreae TaxID=3074107 RepID=UPI00370D08C3
MLTKLQQETINNTACYVQQKLANDYSGHDMAHIERVVHLAKKIQQSEPQSNEFIIIIAAYLHDVIDDKVIENVQAARQELIGFIEQQHVDKNDLQEIMTIIDNMSFSKNLTEKKSLSLEGKIVQDADRLDAIGAIGIGRTFLYGGKKKHIMHDPHAMPRNKMSVEDYRQPSTVINHFYEKLFLLKDQMNTSMGMQIAQERHRFLVEFVDRFEQEWLGK